MLRRLITLFLVRGTSAAGTILLTLIAPLVMDIQSTADFFTGVALIYLLGILSRAGIEMYILKESAARFEEKLRVITRSEIYLFCLPIILAMLFGCIYYAVLLVFEGLGSLKWVFIALPAFSSLGVLSSFLRGTGEELWAGMTEPGILSFFTAIVLSLNIINPVYTFDVVWVFPIVAWVFLFLNIGLVVFYYSVENAKGGSWVAASRGALVFCLNQACSYLTQWYPVFIFGFMDNSYVVYYAVANRIASIISFVGVTIDSFAAPRFSSLWKRKDYAQLVSVRRNISKVSAIVGGMFFIIVVLVGVGYGVANSFGKIYYALVFILCFSYAFSIALGPNGFFLMMTKDNAYVTCLSFFVCLIMVSASSVLYFFDKAFLIVCLVAFLVSMRSFLLFLKCRKLSF